MNILYIEDDPNDATLVDRYVRTTPHNLYIAPTVQDAWLTLQQEPMDLIMVDIVLSNARLGYTFAQQLRLRKFQQPLIAVTALGTPEDMAACRRAGFDQV